MQFLINGERPTLEMIKDCMHGRVQASPEQLLAAMDGCLSRIQAEELKVNMNLIGALDTEISTLDILIEEYTSRYSVVFEKLKKIPGISDNIAAIILAEIGPNVDAFETPKKLAKWVGLCPGQYISNAKSKSGKTIKGNKHVNLALRQAAVAAGTKAVTTEF